MTAHTIRLSKASAVVAGDTLSYAADKRPLGTVSKCLLLPTAKSVMLYRGQSQPCIHGWAELMSQLDLSTIEQIGERLPQILRDISKAYAANARIGDYRRIAMLEVCVVGWSQKDKAVRMVEFFNHDRDYEPQWIPAGSRGISHFPNLPKAAMPQGIESLKPDDQLVANVIAMGQWLADNQNIPTGGEIIAHEVSSKGIESRVLYRYPDYEQMRRDGSAIWGRLERGDYDPDIVRNSLVGVDQAEQLVERKAG